MNYVADYETITKKDDCRVWAYAVAEVDSGNTIEIGNNIYDFMKFCGIEKTKKQDNPTIYFHNLAFDGAFIIDYLLRNGFKYQETKNESKTFNCLITDRGQWFSLNIYFYVSKNYSVKVKILDSYKLLPFSVENMAKNFGLTQSKLKIDYDEYREIGHKLTDYEIDYIKADVEIVAKCLKIIMNENINKLTIASSALYNFKNLKHELPFDKMFPVFSYERDKDMRQAYRGGFTYLNDKFKNKEIKKGLVFDVNSLYPYVMREKLLPYGVPIFYKGQYEYNENFPLYIQCLKCSFKLKKNHIPTIQLKHSLRFIPTEYIKDSEGETVLYLTNIDMDLLFKHYNITDLEYISGYKFKAKNDIFSEYIDFWSAIKIKSKFENNKAFYTISKLMLNSLYGKYGSGTEKFHKIPYLENEEIKFNKSELCIIDPIYVPMAIFITSWARYITITAAQKCYNNFIYADTDSLHLNTDKIPDFLEVDDTKLGAWKLENHIKRGKYLRAKSYIEEMQETDKDGKNILKICVAGLPEKCYEQVTFDNFKVGTVYIGKLTPKRVKGGVVLEQTEFSFKE